MGRLVPVYLWSGLLRLLQCISLFNTSMHTGKNHKNIFVATASIPNSLFTDRQTLLCIPTQQP